MIDSDGAWICIHCGAMRDGGRLCDIPYEVKRILREIEGVELLDEVREPDRCCHAEILLHASHATLLFFDPCIIRACALSTEIPC